MHNKFATVALGPLAAVALGACQPTSSDDAGRNESPPPNSLAPGAPIETSDPDIANTAEASRLESRAGANATPQERVKGDVMGEGAPDTSGRAHQEREKEN